ESLNDVIAFNRNRRQYSFNGGRRKNYRRFEKDVIPFDTGSFCLLEIDDLLECESEPVHELIDVQAKDFGARRVNTNFSVGRNRKRCSYFERKIRDFVNNSLL